MQINNIKWQFSRGGRPGAARTTHAFAPCPRIRHPSLRRNWCAAISERFLRLRRQPRYAEMILAAAPQSAQLFFWNLQTRLRLGSRSSLQFISRIYQTSLQVVAANRTDGVIEATQPNATSVIVRQSQPPPPSWAQRKEFGVGVAGKPPLRSVERHSTTSIMLHSGALELKQKPALRRARVTHPLVTARKAVTFARRSFETSEHILRKLIRTEALPAGNRSPRVFASAASSPVANAGAPARTVETSAFELPAKLNPKEPAMNVAQLADAVLKQLDHRMISARERLGRI